MAEWRKYERTINTISWVLDGHEHQLRLYQDSRGWYLRVFPDKAILTGAYPPAIYLETKNIGEAKAKALLFL